MLYYLQFCLILHPVLVWQNYIDICLHLTHLFTYKFTHRHESRESDKQSRTQAKSQATLLLCSSTIKQQRKLAGKLTELVHAEKFKIKLNSYTLS